MRIRLQMEAGVRELAPFNLGIDSKLRGSKEPAQPEETAAEQMDGCVASREGKALHGDTRYLAGPAGGAY